MRRVLAFGALLAAALAADAAEKPRIVVLGFDGVDSTVVEQMLAAGRLPNLAALKGRGGYSPLLPTVPAQTPVSWATFSTGLDPGGHEIFDFLKRDPADLVPTFAVAQETAEPVLFGRATGLVLGAAGVLVFLAAGAVAAYLARKRAVIVVFALLGLAAGGAVFEAAKAWIPPERPGVKNNRHGKTFWSEDGGRPATVIRMPVTFPPEAFTDGRLLAGPGFPRIGGRIGKPSFYTSDPFFTPREGNDYSIEVIRLSTNTGSQTTKIAGPPGKPFGKTGTIDLPLVLQVLPGRDKLLIAAGGEKAALAAGQWSPWISLPFRINPLITVWGYGRFRVQSVAPEIALYLSPIQFDPAKLPPGFDLSWPNDFAKDLLARFGRYKTMGWAIDTWSIQ